MNKARNRVAAGNLETLIALTRFNIVRIIIVLFYSIVGSPAKTDGIKLCLYVIFVELHQSAYNETSLGPSARGANKMHYRTGQGQNKPKSYLNSLFLGES